MTGSDKIILEEIITFMKSQKISEEDCSLWRAHCLESVDEWPEIRNAWLRVKAK